MSLDLIKIFGSKNDRFLKSLRPLVKKVNDLEPQMQAMSDEELKNQTVLFKDRLAKGETLDKLMPEAFATVREASIRSLGMRHFDVQLIGGAVLHQGKIAEMKTGEGKTLVATLAAYLNALPGKGVHVVTVNDYLAKRDKDWMGKLYNFLGVSCDTIVAGMGDFERKQAYNADITYGTNNEFGFDYLRDNMKFTAESLVQRPLHYAIVDEVDSILIDEARTPLIISGPAEQSTELYYVVNGIIPKLHRDSDYTLDEKARSAMLTEDGVMTVEKFLGVDNLYDTKNIEILHHVNQALKAHTLFKCDVDYIVSNGEVIIVDEFTGRTMEGRRYSDGLHQALEAKENVKIANENQTLATITFQNYFRMYKKLAGMTGTADTEAAEFGKIYNLAVVVIPPNRVMVRKDAPDAIYKSRREKFEAVMDDIERLHKIGQPVLVGTISVDISEDLSKKLTKRGIKHEVLNAKNHAKEAEIITLAGQKGAVTIATNMAGRGTDIVLGEGVKDLGGLHIIGTERHESRRIDNQLRGRSGRQGDPGASRFYLSLEDDLMRIFGGESMRAIMERLGLDEGEAIENRMVSRAIERAQCRVEGHNFEIRKQLLNYDDVMNQQREVIYTKRREILQGADISEDILDMIYNRVQAVVDEVTEGHSTTTEEMHQPLKDAIFVQFNIPFDFNDENAGLYNRADSLKKVLYDQVEQIYEDRQKVVDNEHWRTLERYILLQTVDTQWKDHLLSMDHFKEGIGLRGYAQQDPLRVYRKEGYDMFLKMNDRIEEETTGILFRIQVQAPEDVEVRRPQEPKLVLGGPQKEGAPRREPVKTADSKVGRNDVCPCGSGKKYKKCCGLNE